MSTVEVATEIRPFNIDITEEQIDDLRRRIAATRWPSRELVDDRSQGVQLATLRELARYWTTDYDFRRLEARLNALPHSTTEIDGVEIHFIHVRSAHENALPLIMTHGWPGSVIELLETIGPLTDPTEHGGRAEDAFHVVLPSLPGYGFSGEPTELGWDTGRVASAWAELMRRLGYSSSWPRAATSVQLSQTRWVGRHRRNSSAFTRTCSSRFWQEDHRRRNPRRSTPRSRRLIRSGRAALAITWSRPRGRKRSAMPWSIHLSDWRHGCSTTTRTATTRCPGPSSTESPRGTSHGTTSSTTSRRIG